MRAALATAVLVLVNTNAAQAGVVIEQTTRSVASVASVKLEHLMPEIFEQIFSDQSDGSWSETASLEDDGLFSSFQMSAGQISFIAERDGALVLRADPEMLTLQADIQDPGFDSTVETFNASEFEVRFVVDTPMNLSLEVDLGAGVSIQPLGEPPAEVRTGTLDNILAQASFSLCGEVTGCVVDREISDSIPDDGMTFGFSSDFEQELAPDTYTLRAEALGVVGVREDAFGRAFAYYGFSVLVPEPNARAQHIAALVVLLALSRVIVSGSSLTLE